jgi:hypothetical protein
MIIWFKTDAFIIYSKLFGVNSLFPSIQEWEDYRKYKDISVGYHQYLRIKNPDGFFIKLATCPICLGIWLTIPTTILCGITVFPTVAFLSIFLYLLTIKLM